MVQESNEQHGSNINSMHHLKMDRLENQHSKSIHQGNTYPFNILQFQIVERAWTESHIASNLKRTNLRQPSPRTKHYADWSPKWRYTLGIPGLLSTKIRALWQLQCQTDFEYKQRSPKEVDLVRVERPNLWAAKEASRAAKLNADAADDLAFQRAIARRIAIAWSSDSN